MSERNGDKVAEVERVVYDDPIALVFGGEVFEVEELRSGACRKWQKKVTDIQTGMVREGMSEEEIRTNPEKLSVTIESMMLKAPEKYIDLIFDYHPDLKKNRKRIEEQATMRELFEAIVQLIRVSFPFAYGMTRLMPVSQT